jgi:hypothetical protein
MGHAVETIDNESIETGYWMRELEFPESPDTWEIDDFADLVSTND